MRIGAQFQEVEEVVQVDLPVPLGVDRHRQADARQLAGDLGVEQLLVGGVGRPLAGQQQVEHARPDRRVDLDLATPLPVVGALEADLRLVGQVHLVGQDRIPGAELVDAVMHDEAVGDEVVVRACYLQVVGHLLASVLNLSHAREIAEEAHRHG